MLRNMTLTLKFFCALSICATALALIPLAAHADYSHGNSGILMLSPNSLPGLTIGPAEQYVSAGTNTLQAWVKNDSNSTRTIYATKGVCRCQEAIGYPYRTGVGQCQYYWSPDSSSSRPGCQATNETITLPPYGSYLMSASVSQYNSQSCGSFQIDFYFDGKIWVGSFANIEINCPTPTIACSSDSQCGTNGYIDSPYCSSSLNIYQSYKTYTCKNPGTTSSYCSSETLSKLKNTCDDGEETCSNGYCIDNIPTLIASCSASPNPANTNQTVTFVPSVSGGTGSYSYSWTGACNGYSQNCNNSFSSSGTQTAFLQITSESQTANTSCQVSVNQSCNSNSYKQCYNDDVYWYDSCGNRGSRYQECNSSQACYNGTCIGQSNYTYTYNTTTATLNKTVINLSSGALNYSASVAANPNNIVQFRVIIQNGSNQTISNITVRDVLPSRLSYYGLITLDGAAISGNLASGLYISNLAPGQQKTVTYQAQLASDQNFSFGTTTLTNIASLTSTDSSFIPVSASAYVNVTRTGVAGATSVPTGWSDSLLSGSLLVPFLAAIAAVWFLNRGEQKIPTWVGSAARKKEG